MSAPARAAPPPRWLPLAAAASLFLVYLATLAPGVTFWDAGEFISAAASWGIPHPPGTPLYVALLRAWSLLLPLSTPLATNLFSAACTAAAGGLLAWWLARSGHHPWSAFAAAFVAGTMSSVWLNATETEVYAASLLLAMLTVAAGLRAGEGSDAGAGRWTVLTAYLLVLAVPLHLSALVAAPAAIYAASSRADGSWEWRRAIGLTGAMVVAVGVSRASLPMVIAGALAVAWGARRLRVAVAVAVAASALLVMLLRARHDPWLNQGNPATWDSLVEVISRRQYAVAGLWPRRAPAWLQLANVVQYADWQVAMSLGRSVFATVPRVVATAAFVLLGMLGAFQHRAVDRRGFRVALLLFLAGTLGVMTYLNLQAGPSLGHGFVPPGAHEARERDYFFVIGFLAWGAWAGLGAIAVGERLRQPAAGVALAALPCALNWRAVTRTAHPERGLPAIVAHALLEAAPPRAVLLASGDNDTYPLWAAQAAEGLRRDVTVVTVPLLPAGWYREELVRRHGLLPPEWAARWYGDDATFRTLAYGAFRAGRPLVASPQLPTSQRMRFRTRWVLRGPVYLAVEDPAAPPVAIDTAAALRWAGRFEAWRHGAPASPSIDPTTRWWLRLLSCPGSLVRPRPARSPGAGADAVSDSLESTCNLR